MNFIYKETPYGEFVIKYGITFNVGEIVKVDDESLIEKLTASPLFEYFLEDEAEKPKRKYTKRKNKEDIEIEAQNEPQAETTPEAEAKAELEAAE